MYKKADPGYLGNPVHGIWPQSSDPPLYIPNKNRSTRGHSGLMSDFWNFPEDTFPDNEDIIYPKPNAWRRTRAPFALGNIPSLEDIYKEDQDLISPWSGSPRSYRYHGNNFMIDGPYGDSGDALSDNYFYNNLVPVQRIYQNYPTEKMLNSDSKNWYNYYRYRRYPTLPLRRRRLTQNLWDFMGEPTGPNTNYYGTEPLTGGGGPGILDPHASTKGVNLRIASQYNPKSIQDIDDLVNKIKKHRGSLEYSELSLYIEPLIIASMKSQFKSLKLIGVAKKIRNLSKKLQRTNNSKQRMKIVSQIKSLIKNIWQKITSKLEEKGAQKNSSFSYRINWYSDNSDIR